MKFDTQDFDSLSPRQKKTLTDLLLRISEDIDSVRKITNWSRMDSPWEAEDLAAVQMAEEFFNDMYVALIKDDLEDKGYAPIGSKANAYK